MEAMKKKINIQENFNLKTTQKLASLDWLYDFGIKNFSKINIPETKKDSYYLTNPSELFKNPFNPLSEENNCSFTQEQEQKILKIIKEKKLFKNHISIVNDVYNSKLSKISDTLKHKITINDYKNSSKKNFLKKFITSKLKSIEDPFLFLNYCFSSHLYVYEINGTIQHPIQFFFFKSKNSNSIVENKAISYINNANHFFFLKKNSKAQFLFHSINLEDSNPNHSPTWINKKNQFFLKENSVLNLLEIQEECSSENNKTNIEIEAILQKKAQFNYFSFNFKPQWLRKIYHIHLKERNSSFQFHNMNILSGKEKEEKFYQWIYVNHCNSKTKSNQNIQNLLMKKSRSNTHSEVFMDTNAQKSSSKQLIKGLLLSKESSTSNRPYLRIFTDNIKAKHGHTVGSLDKEVIFYLKSRGLNRKISIKILIHSFLNSILTKIRSKAIKKFLEKKIKKNIFLSKA